MMKKNCNTTHFINKSEPLKDDEEVHHIDYQRQNEFQHKMNSQEQEAIADDQNNTLRYRLKFLIKKSSKFVSMTIIINRSLTQELRQDK